MSQSFDIPETNDTPDTNGAPAATEKRGAKRVGSPPKSFAEGHDRRNTVDPVKAEWPGQAGPLWLAILEWLKTEKIGERDATPDDVMIGVQRISGGSGGVMFPDPIEGGTVCGDETESGDVALMRTLTDTYHMLLSDRRSRATFRLKFYWRSGGKGDIKWSEPITLPSPEDVMKSRAAKPGGTDPEIASPIPTQLANGQPLPPGIPPELLLELGSLREHKARAEGRLPPAPPAPAGPSAQDWETRLKLEREVAEAKAKAESERAAREAAEKYAAEKADMQRQLDAMKAAEERAAIQRQLDELKAAIARGPAQPQSSAQEMLVLLQHLGIVEVDPATGQPRRVGAAAPAAPPPPVEQSAEGLAEQIVSHQKSADAAKAKLRAALGLRDANEASAVVEKEEEDDAEDESFWGKIAKGIGSNMDVIAQGGLSMVPAIADALLVPNAAAAVKGAAAAAQEQMARKAQGRAIPGVGGGGGGPSRPPSV